MNNNIHSIYNINNTNKWFAIRSFYFNSYKNYTMKMHSHKRIEVMYVNFGEMEIEYLDHDIPKKMTLMTGEYVFIDAFYPHRITIYNNETQVFCIELSFASMSEEDNTSIHITLGTFIAHEPTFKKFIENNEPFFKLYDDGTVLEAFVCIQRYLQKKEDNTCDSYINLNLGALFLWIAKTQQEQYANKIGIVYLKKAIFFINENYHSSITSKQIANQSNISQSYLNKLFKDAFAMTVNEYLNKLRIERSKKLIEQSNLSLTEIYKLIGLNSKQSFNRHFLRYNNMSPSEYRKNARYKMMRKSYIDGKDNIRYPDYVYNFVHDSSLTLEE